MWRKLTCWLHSATWGTQDTQTRDRAEEVGRKGEVCKEEVVGGLRLVMETPLAYTNGPTHWFTRIRSFRIFLLW